MTDIIKDLSIDDQKSSIEAEEAKEVGKVEKAEEAKKIKEVGKIEEAVKVGKDEEAVKVRKDEEAQAAPKDEYGREILPLTFENILTMSCNSLKLNYSRLKNQICSYNKVTSNFNNGMEVYQEGQDILFQIYIQNNIIHICCALPEGSLDQAVYPHKIMGEEEFVDTPIEVVVDTDKVSLENAIELINLTMDINGILPLESPIPVAYAERYPFQKNAALKGQEHIAPSEFNGAEYEHIEGEVIKYLSEKIYGAKEQSQEEKKGKEKLEDIRQTASTLKAALALAEPIVYYYDVAVERENTPAFVDIKQVLNDRFLGKMIPQHYFAIAEGSQRIKKLNFLTLKKAVEECNNKPDTKYATIISCRLLIRKASLDKLISFSKTENENLILAFDARTLEELGQTGIDAIARLKEAGVMIMLDNIEKAGLRTLTDYYLDYLRLDARYYTDEQPKTVSHLDMLVGYAQVQGITTVAMHVDNIKQSIFMIKHKVDVIQGRSVSTPKRQAHVALRKIKPLPISGG